MKEIISIHVGQSGIQAGNACWELFCLEHDIQPDCKAIQNSNLEEDLKTNFFQEIKQDQFVPRCVYLDLESAAIDEVKTSYQKNLFDPDFLVSANLNSAWNFGRGQNLISNEFIDTCMDKIRKQAESCSELQGFLIYNSVGGGTGSGFGSLITSKIKENFQKQSNLGLTIYPSDSMQKSQFESYNSVLAIKNQIENGDVNIVLDNEAIYDICKINLDIQKPTYTDLNKIIAQAVSQLTCSLRFSSSILTNLQDFQQNLIPSYTKFCFMLSSYSPILKFDNINQTQFTVQEISNFLFQPSNMMAKCNPSKGQYMAINITFRGKDIVPKDVSICFGQWKYNQTMKLVDWRKQVLQVGINYNSPKTVVPGSIFQHFDKSVSMISNSTSISEVFSRINQQFDSIYSKKEFIDIFKSDGIEEQQLFEAREELGLLEQDYQEAQKIQDDSDEQK